MRRDLHEVGPGASDAGDAAAPRHDRRLTGPELSSVRCASAAPSNVFDNLQAPAEATSRARSLSPALCVGHCPDGSGRAGFDGVLLNRLFERRNRQCGQPTLHVHPSQRVVDVGIVGQRRLGVLRPVERDVQVGAGLGVHVGQVVRGDGRARVDRQDLLEARPRLRRLALHVEYARDHGVGRHIARALRGCAARRPAGLPRACSART